MRHRAVAAMSLTVLIAIVSLRQVASEGAAIAMVTVDAKHPWVDSGLAVRKGERVSFEAIGTVKWGGKPGKVAGPDGHDAKAGKPGKGGLIGRVGFTGKPFPIGSTRTPVTMPQSGKLFLGINDFIFKDNAGSFMVTISHVTQQDTTDTPGRVLARP